MAGLCWMAVMLSVLLSAVDRADAVDRGTLWTWKHLPHTSLKSRQCESLSESFAESHRYYFFETKQWAVLCRVLLRYQPMEGGMFSLAVSIPLLENTNSLQQVLKGSDPVKNVKDALNKDEVYVGRRVVAAKFLEQVQHAESRVLDHLDALFTKQEENNQDMLLFYVYTPKNKNEVTNKVTYDYEVPYADRSDALLRLGNQIGLDHVFRCKKPEGSNRMVCIRCDNGNQVAHKCISNEAEPAPRQSQPSSQLKKPQQGQGVPPHKGETVEAGRPAEDSRGKKEK
ncbi:hypothetical protein F7725_006047 [Dissostichus mawsoni]|uniref:Uncharacterized protein n=1 Tax=Dissostichus mawsoni TaxID=36200 RepID=A0A7J5YSZ3_DISMA|nr:hypothetical protein F7725_006047 [Dissostichus mawsoni]